MAREVLSNGVINPDKYQADWYADLSNNWHLLNNLIGSAISGSEVDSKIATAIQELMVRTFQIVAELPQTGTEGVMYLVLIPNTSKYTAYVWENNAYRELGVIQMTITIDDELSTTSENPVQNKVITNALNNKANSSHTHSASDITSGLAAVATSGAYSDLTGTPTIPTVNNATLTIQRNGTTLDTFTANASVDKTINISTTDDTKIPLAGTNALSGSIIPSTDNVYDFGDSSHNYKIVYAKEIRHGLSSGSLVCSGGNGTTNGANLVLYGTNRSDGFQGRFDLVAKGSSDYKLTGLPNGTLTWGSKNVAMQEDVIPRSGGAVFTGQAFSRNVNDSSLIFRGGTNAWENGAELELHGKGLSNNAGKWRLTSNNGSDYSAFEMDTNGTIYATHGAGLNVTYATHYNWVEVNFCGGDSRDNGSSLQLHGKDFAAADNLYAGAFILQARRTFDYQLLGLANGTLTWNGQPIQTSSDQRLKQQITEIDDKLLDAWEDVNLVQFKYNDAVEQKGDNARLHTGYVVQQIDEACQSHGVDISAYGLYCHEEYPQETEEVEVEQTDGTKTKETKVIREASEHYSLRYTEALIVECAYLRKCIKELRNEIEELKSSK